MATNKNKLNRDPGTGTAFRFNSKRVINKNGSFNVIKKSLKPSYRDIYQVLIKLSWPRFFLIVFAYLFIVNGVFALIITIVGIEGLSNMDSHNFATDFLNAYYFSFQTFTTVGYGAMAPEGHVINLVAIFVAILGWLSFALITGILYGRFSKPSARLKYSHNALMAPYKGGINCLQFRIANMRKSTLIEMEATVLLMTVKTNNGVPQRYFTPLELERDRVLFFPLNWTIVHPIDEQSPLYDKTQRDLEEMNTELLILIKGFDDTFSQTVHSRYSYKFNEIIWGAKFISAYFPGDSGDEVIDFNLMDAYEEMELN